ncbi:MAG: hypothetical protein N4A74_07105, partial [Carboxylicivirga sp.]|nr:hypothetical protein [Carboxylicivirga sp.]
MKSKKVIYTILLCLLNAIGYSQINPTQTKNYIKTSTPQTENGLSGNTLHTVQYFDGLGRPDQNIQIGASPGGY